jgi:hypothetical protein
VKTVKGQAFVRECSIMMMSSNRTLLFVMLVMLGLLGGAVLYFTMEFLSLLTPGDGPPVEARSHQIGLVFLVVAMLAGMPAVGVGAYVMYIGSRICATKQWPPAGMGFRVKAPVMLGERGSRVGRIVIGLGMVCVVGGLLLPVVAWQWGVSGT